MAPTPAPWPFGESHALVQFRVARRSDAAVRVRRRRRRRFRVVPCYRSSVLSVCVCVCVLRECLAAAGSPNVAGYMASPRTLCYVFLLTVAVALVFGQQGECVCV